MTLSHVLGGNAPSRGLLTQALPRFRKTYALVPPRQGLGPVRNGLAARPRAAATGAGAPATRLAAQAPKLKQLCRELQVSFKLGACLGHLQLTPSFVIARLPLSPCETGKYTATGKKPFNFSSLLTIRARLANSGSIQVDRVVDDGQLEPQTTNLGVGRSNRSGRAISFNDLAYFLDVPVGNLIRVARTLESGVPTVNPIRLASDSESGNAFARWLIFAD